MHDLAGFWDARAAEDALYFSHPQRPFGAPEDDELWASGERDLAAVLGDLGAPALVPGARVLDLGCGVGRLTRALTARGAEVVAADVSATMLARARELHGARGGVAWVRTEGRSLAPVPAAAADAVVSLGVLDRQPDPRLTLRLTAEVARVLRPGGWAALQVSTDPDVHHLRPGAGQRVRARLGRDARGLGDRRWLGSSVPLEALAATALEAGLEIERIEGPGTARTLVLARRS